MVIKTYSAAYMPLGFHFMKSYKL